MQALRQFLRNQARAQIPGTLSEISYMKDLTCFERRIEMLSDIYYRKKLGIPYLSLIFLATCFLVSIPSYFFPELIKVLGGMKPMNYPWQYITMVFGHGFFRSSHNFIHLLVNAI